MPFTETDWYDTPRYYDLVFDSSTAVEADFLEDAQAWYGRTRGRRVLEPACGSGRLVLELARRGWKVTGFDRSAAMLAYARERLDGEGLEARLDERRMESFRYREGFFDLAHCLVSTFKYLLDEGSARSHLECVARALKPGGIYVLGFHLSEYGTTSRARERWVVEEGSCRVVCNIQSWPPDRKQRREEVRSRLVVSEEGRERRSETNWSFRTYDARQVRRLFRSVPALELVAVHDFNHNLDETIELDGSQLDCVFILRRVTPARVVR